MTLMMVLLAALAVASEGGGVEVVERLYKYVVQNHPLGIPSDAGMRTIGPLLSNRVTAILDAGRACEADYFRQHKEALGDEKPEFGWLEWGLFSGGNESAIPVEFRIVTSAREPSGGSRVVVELTYRDTPETYRWRVAALVKTENGRFVIDDVVHDAERADASRWRLSTSFKGCAGGRWVGVRH
jgi:hypothetical protein